METGGSPPICAAAAAAPPVMTQKAAGEILAILEGLPPPDGTSGFGGRAVAYKTGTSYGFRDAWSIGVSADWTVGVWVGRPDGTPRPGAYGLNTAAPVMARVFSLLPADQGALPVPIIALPPPPGEDPSWLPPSPGFFRITAIDQRGAMDSETIQVR